MQDLYVIVLSQPCYDLFDENILANELYHEYQKRRVDLYVGYMITQRFPTWGTFASLKGYF